MIPGMDIVLCDISALEYWRTADPCSPSARHAVRSSALPTKAPGKDLVEAAVLQTLGTRSRPVHLLVSDEAGRKPSAHAVYHACSSVPSRSLVAIGHDVAATSPELSFARLGASLSIAKLIAIGCEQTGTYALAPDSPDGFVRQEPLTSVEQLRIFTQSIEGLPGIKRARRAARFVLPGSASPAETNLALLLHLPYSMGAYNVRTPLLNHRIDLDRRARALASKPFVRCDLCWPEARLCIEYDSDAQHTGSERIARDSKRRNALISMGYSVITVTKRQLYSRLEMDGIARAVAKALGTRIRPCVSDFEDRTFKLRAELLGAPR